MSSTKIDGDSLAEIFSNPVVSFIVAADFSAKVDITPGKLSIGTMHLAKGLELRAVAVMACDDEIIPSPERIENVADNADLEEVYDSERHLLYVACTCARDFLLVTGVKPASEFLDDLNASVPVPHAI
jgi:superfamily I DNA/RNA helicase